MKAFLYIGTFALLGAIGGLVLYTISPLLAFALVGYVIVRTFIG